MSFVKNSLLALLASSIFACAAEKVVTVKIVPEKDATGKVLPLDKEKFKKQISELNHTLIFRGFSDAHIPVDSTQQSFTFAFNTEIATEADIKFLMARNTIGVYKRHPQSDKLVQAFVENAPNLPEGFQLVYQDVKNSAGKVVSTRPVIITNEPALTKQDIETSRPDLSSNSLIFVELNSGGAKKMEAFTRPLRSTQDQIVILLNGKVINIATIVEEVLSKNFVISGLDNLKECELLSRAITTNFPYEMKIVSIKPVEPAAKATE